MRFPLSSRGPAGTATEAHCGSASTPFGRGPVGHKQVDLRPSAAKAFGAVQLTTDELVATIPELGSHTLATLQYINLALRCADIMDRPAAAMFVAQMAHESANFRLMEEMGGKIKFTAEKFPKASNPDNKVYDYFLMMYDVESPLHSQKNKALELGNDKPGDGAKYHGRGYIQITGKFNYTAAGKDLALDLVNHPELAAQPENAARIAAWYWKRNRLERFTHGDLDTAFVHMTRVINGGERGLEDRFHIFFRALRAMGIERSPRIAPALARREMLA